MEDARQEDKIGILEVFEQLPLFRSLYLYMQLQNIDIVDSYLEELEAGLLHEYSQTDRLPPSFAFVSAISQLWIFGLYELLRTWRQWVGELIAYGEELEKLTKEPSGEEAKSRRIEDQKVKLRDVSSVSFSDVFYDKSFTEIETNPSYLKELRWARDLVLPLFRRVELLRVTLAKHEVPKSKGKRAYMPGYARIDMTTGSLYWPVLLKNATYDSISRGSLADECRHVLQRKWWELRGQMLEGKDYLRERSTGVHYPDDHPYILELKRKKPEALWDRYIPSELILERMTQARSAVAKLDPEAAKEMVPPDLPSATWVYNAMWEDEWDNEEEEIRQRFEKPLSPSTA